MGGDPLAAHWTLASPIGRSTDPVRAHLTSEGMFVVGASTLLVMLGVITGRPGVIGLGLLGGVWLAAAWVIGWWNLRNIQAIRRLPADLFAERDAPGSLVLRGNAVDVRIEEADRSAAAAVDRCVDEQEVAVHWVFPARGLHHLSGLLIRSRHPFGWIEWTRALDARVEIVVWPQPGRLSERRGAQPIPSSEDDDFVGLRAYRPGDPPRSIHWRTSARAGTPMVALRRGETAAPRWIRVELHPGRPGERRLSDATAEVLDAAEDGRPVGLLLGDERIEAAIGQSHIRRLLDALAMAVLPEGS